MHTPRDQPFALLIRRIYARALRAFLASGQPKLFGSFGAATTGTKSATETLDAALGIDESLLPGEKRVREGTDVDWRQVLTFTPRFSRLLCRVSHDLVFSV